MKVVDFDVERRKEKGRIGHGRSRWRMGVYLLG